MSGNPVRLHKRLPLLLALLLAGLTAAIYLQGIAGPWIFDDFPNLQPLLDSRAQGWSGLLERFLMSDSGPLGRPVSMLTFIFSAMVSGDNLAGWKLFNILAHLATGFALLWLARYLLEELGGWQPRSAWYGAVLVTALWLLHPLHVSTVLYTVQRMTILPALFCALGLALYLGGRRALARDEPGWGRILAAILVCWPLAAFSKENGALLGLYILMLELLLPPLALTSQRRRIHGLLGLTVALPAVLAVIYVLINPGWVLGGYQLRDFSMLERLLTEGRVVWAYVLWIFMPLPRFLGFMHDDIELSTSLLQPLTTVAALFAWLTVFAILIVMRRRSPLPVAGAGIFILSQLLESTIIPLELVFEHRTYFGSFGLLLAVVWLLGSAVRHPVLRSALFVLVLGGLAVLLLLRVQVWSDINRLYSSMWLSHPTSPRLITTFAAQFARNGEYAAAMETLARSREPRTAVARLYVLCLRDGRLADGEIEQLYPVAPRRITDYLLSGLVAVSALGQEGSCQFDERRFIALLDRVVTTGNLNALGRYKVLIYRAHHQNRLGLLQDALESLNAAAGLQTDSFIPLSLRCEWLLRAGRLADARLAFSQLEAKVAQSDIDFSARMEELQRMLEQAEQNQG